MHAFLIESEELTILPEEFSEFKKITFEITKINEVHDLRKLLKFAPIAKTLFIITGLNEASIEAQNSLLKILEEPQSTTVNFLMAVKNTAGILPTILSRVTLVQTQKKIEGDKTTETFSVDNLLNILNIKDRADAKSFLLSVIRTKKESVLVKEAAEEALVSLNKNANVGLALLNFGVKARNFAPS